MAHEEPAPQADDMDSEQPQTASQEEISTDLAQGYQFLIIARPEGFTVVDPEPIAAAPQGEGELESGEMIADRTGLVKAILGVLEAHPLGEEGSAPTGEQAGKQMAAGFGSVE